MGDWGLGGDCMCALSDLVEIKPEAINTILLDVSLFHSKTNRRCWSECSVRNSRGAGAGGDFFPRVIFRTLHDNNSSFLQTASRGTAMNQPAPRQ